MRTKTDYTVSTGNVFADLGFPNAQEMLAQAELAQKITAILTRRQLTQAESAKLLDVDQPKISARKRGRLSGFSLERLVRFLILLGRDVEIAVNERRRPRGQARLLVA